MSAAGEVMSWRVERRRPMSRVAAAILAVIGTLILARDGSQYAAGLALAAVFGALAARDLLVPVRLSADPEGLTVLTGLARQRRIPWRDVERIHVDTRNRLGLRQSALEIDEGGSLHVLDGSDLGADPLDVAATLTQLRTGR
jgi:hypothetical protein